MNRTVILTALGLLVTGIGSAQEVDWPTYGNDPGGTKYSMLEQINRDDIYELRREWSWKTAGTDPDGARAADRAAGQAGQVPGYVPHAGWHTLID